MVFSLFTSNTSLGFLSPINSPKLMELIISQLEVEHIIVIIKGLED